MDTDKGVQSIFEGLPYFRLRSWRDDRGQADEFVKEAAADRLRRQYDAASLEAVSANRRQERAGEVVTMARRHAAEIRAAGDHEPDRIPREAEPQAAFLHDERLQAHRRDLDRIVANRNCWMSVTTDEGKPTERPLKPSETIVARAREAVTLNAGNAAALSILINGQPAAPLGLVGQVVARRITRENYRTLLLSSSDQETTIVAQLP